MKEFKVKYELINQSDIVSLENLIGGRLPEDYKKHMLKYNGGNVPFEYDYLYLIGRTEIKLSGFHPIKHGDNSIEEYFNHKHEFLFPNLISIGKISGGFLAMRINGDSYGAIYTYFSDGVLDEVAESFGDFIKNIEVLDADI